MTRAYGDCLEQACPIGDNGNALYGYIVERPVAYITSKLDRRLYEGYDIKVLDSKDLYRSVHYIGRHDGVFFEVQVRSIFEESWLEFSHSILYPYDVDNEKKKAYVRILRDATSAADGLITFYDEADPAWDNADSSKEVATIRAIDTADNDLDRLTGEDAGTSNLMNLLAARY